MSQLGNYIRKNDNNIKLCEMVKVSKDRLNLLPDFTFFLSAESSEIRYDSSFSDFSTWMKQLVVCPIPEGSIRSLNIELMTVLFPLLVLLDITTKQLKVCYSNSFTTDKFYLPKNATFMWSRESTSRIPLTFSTWLLTTNNSSLVIKSLSLGRTMSY
jgi:hypothetical protein